MKKIDAKYNEINEEEDKKKRMVVIAKKRKEKNRRIFLLLVMMVMTGIMFASSTYAWFTSNKTVSVSDVQVNVTSKNGIQISADATNWKSVIQLADLLGAQAGKYPGAVNQIPSTANSIEPVSSALNVDANGKMEMFRGNILSSNLKGSCSVGEGAYTTEADCQAQGGAWTPGTEGENILTATKENETNGTEGNYVAFDLFFKVDSDKDVPVYLSAAGSGVKASGADNGIKQASRIAFVELGHAVAGTSVAQLQALNAGAASKVYLWEPNYDIHTPAGVAHARDVYGITTTETNGGIDSYSGVKAEITEDKNILWGSATEEKNATYFKKITPTYQTKADWITGTKEIFTLSSGITKMRIYMWVEGQDVDCENVASGTNIIYSLQITTEK